MKTTRPYTDIDVLQTRVAARLVGKLGESAAGLPHDLNERLRSAREQALDRARASRRAQVNTPQCCSGQCCCGQNNSPSGQ